MIMTGIGRVQSIGSVVIGPTGTGSVVRGSKGKFATSAIVSGTGTRSVSVPGQASAKIRGETIVAAVATRVATQVGAAAEVAQAGAVADVGRATAEAARAGAVADGAG